MVQHKNMFSENETLINVMLSPQVFFFLISFIFCFLHPLLVDHCRYINAIQSDPNAHFTTVLEIHSSNCPGVRGSGVL